MKFLFPTTVVWDGEKYRYKLYQFKLTPDKFRAELTSASFGHPIKEIIFWRKKNAWKADLKNSQLFVEIFGKEIERTNK